MEVIVIQIPKLNHINKALKSLKSRDVYYEAMVNLAAHHVKNALIYLVLYVHKTGCDLSKELLSLAHHPSSLSVCTKTARILEESEMDRENVKFNESSSDDLSFKPKKSSSELLNDMCSNVIHEMNKLSLSGINVVLLDKNHNVYRYHYNELSSIPEADLGLDLIKKDLLNKADGSSHDIGGVDNSPHHSTPKFPNDGYFSPFNPFDLTTI